jgi:hypothetical protein
MANLNGWAARAKAAAKSLWDIGKPLADEGRQSDLGRAEGEFGYDQVSTSILLGSGFREARSRTQIYQKFHFMMGDPLISAALRGHVTSALGGDETTGDVVFIDTKAEADQDPRLKKLVEEIKADLEPIFNRVAHQVAFNASGFGDAYGRIYTQDGVGLVDLYTDEMVYPPLVQPYSRGSRTEGFVVSSGKKFSERLTITQMTRCRMPRMLYLPQVRAVEKAMKIAIGEDDIDAMPLLPDLVGGSFLEAAEEAYDDLRASLVGLIGQRILNSIDETMVGVNLSGMTLEQRREFMTSIKDMLKASKKYAEDAVKRGTPVTERRYHLIPTFDDKQVTRVEGFQGQSSASAISIEDVLFHAKRLAGALGYDLSMMGFSDMLSGGLGEGGFFRTSIQAAERSRIIRNAVADFFYDAVDLHCLAKYGWVFDRKDRPFNLTFYGAISALEAEKQASRERAMSSSTLMLSALTQLKELGMDEKVNRQFIEKIMDIDEGLAEKLASGIAEAIKKTEDAQAAEMAGGDEGGPFGGPATAPARQPGAPRQLKRVPGLSETDGDDDEAE